MLSVIISKLFFDNYARRYFDKAESQIAGFRYFNVSGPRRTTRARWHPWCARCSCSGRQNIR